MINMSKPPPPLRWHVTVWGQVVQVVTGRMDVSYGVLWFRTFDGDTLVDVTAFPLSAVQQFTALREER